MTLAPLSPPAPAASSLLIPRVIHRVWLNDDAMPAEYEAFGESWARHHPEWEMRLWRPSDLPPLRNQELFDNATSLAQKSDIARYEILLRFGGIYVDTDFECLRPFEDLLDGVGAFIGTEDGTHLTNALLGAAPGHPLLEALVDGLPASIAARPNGPANQTTGPHFVTRVVEADPELRETLRVFPSDVFYPYLYNESYRRDEAFPDSYAVHHWAGSWLPTAPPDVPPRHRVVLATDWSEPAATASILEPFARLFGPTDPIELVLAVPGEPGEREVEHARGLLEALVIDGDACAPLSLESFAEAADAPYDIAVVPSGNADRLLLEVGAAVSWLHTARALIDQHGRPAMAAARGNAVLGGDTAGLRHRFNAFGSAPKPAPAPAPAAARPQAPAHSATYVGNNRLLVSTTWGGKLFMSASDLSLTPDVVHRGNYDEPFTRFVMKTLRRGDVAFDVGANVGLFTVLMGGLVGPEGRVVAYEAAPENVALLSDNVAMNYYGGWVDVVAKAAAAQEGTLPFYATTRFQGNGSMLPHDEEYAREYPVDGQRRLEIPAEPLDVHLGRFETINLVKIDVEGGEEQVFAGMEALVASGAVERICFELLRARMGADWEPMAARLRRFAAAGWTLSVVDGKGELLPAGVERLLEIGQYSQVLLQRPGLQPR
jgi:FkbM family methyltransferase